MRRITGVVGIRRVDSIEIHVPGRDMGTAVSLSTRAWEAVDSDHHPVPMALV
jgi:hypothetical protein